MIVLYGAMILGILILYILTRGYKADIRKQIYAGKLYFMSGLSMYIVDRLHRRFGILNNENTQKKIQKLDPGKDCKNQMYSFWIDKISYIILGAGIFMVLGFLNSISLNFEGNNQVKMIQRPETGEGSKTYYLDVVSDGDIQEKKNIALTLEEYHMSEEEIRTLLDEKLDYALSGTLGENTGFDNITKPLDFANRDSDMVSILYSVNEDGYILENGELNENQIYEYYDKNKKESVTTFFTIIASYGDYSREYKQEIEIKINKEEDILAHRIMREISQNSGNEKTIVLPDTLDGNRLQFYEKKETETAIFIILSIGVGILMSVTGNRRMKKQLERRSMQLEMDYASIVSKLTLLSEAGSTILLAWDKIIADYEKEKEKYGNRYAYEEMKIARHRMKNGMAEAEAYAEFGRRCDTASYVKLGCLLEQNIKKGTKGLKTILAGEVREAFAGRKLIAKKKGEEASTKLLLPMTIMLIISMVVVVVPAFMSMG